MSNGPFSGNPRIATGSLFRGSARERGGSLRSLTRSAATSFFSSKTTTLAGRGMPAPSGWTWVTTSPATTWALVTTMSGAATQPVPSMPIPQATPVTRTTREAAACTSGSLMMLASGSATSASGPWKRGMGSSLLSACARRLEGILSFRTVIIPDSCMDGCRDANSGVPSAKAAATQTRVRESVAPRIAPPARSRTSPSTANATMLTSVMIEPKTGSLPLRSSTAGTSLDPRIAPSTTPTSERAPARKPVRAPRQARKRTNSRIKASRKFTPRILPSRGGLLPARLYNPSDGEEEKVFESQGVRIRHREGLKEQGRARLPARAGLWRPLRRPGPGLGGGHRTPQAFAGRALGGGSRGRPRPRPRCQGDRSNAQVPLQDARRASHRDGHDPRARQADGLHLDPGRLPDGLFLLCDGPSRDQAQPEGSRDRRTGLRRRPRRRPRAHHQRGRHGDG